MRKPVVRILPTLLIPILLVPLLAAPADAAGRDRSLAQLVRVEGIRAHQRALQRIADFNGGTRAATTDGHEVSVAYVADQLKRAGYKPTVQRFEFDYFEEPGPSALERLAPEPKTYTQVTDFKVLAFSILGDVTAEVAAVDTESATSGCETEDFDGFPSGSIALLKRGTCLFGLKVANAAAAGAVGALVYNDGTGPDRMEAAQATLGEPSDIPALSLSHPAGLELLALVGQGLRVRLFANTLNERRTSANVLAETRHGRHDNVVLVGAHLDSVMAGPGINDNGSGVGAVLEIAKQLPKLGRTNNAVRFAFWGAEEIGQIGSNHYVTELTEEEAAKIALVLNYDMLGSPNFVRFVYDGDNSTGEGFDAPPGSGAIEKTFVDYFASRGLATEPTPLDGRSDYAPFLVAGIPVGGLFSGAEGVKTAEQAAVYGGTAGVPYDECYHLACDTVENVSRRGLDQLSDAAAHAVQTFARSTLVVNGVAPRRDRRPAAAATAVADLPFAGDLARR